MAFLTKRILFSTLLVCGACAKSFPSALRGPTVLEKKVQTERPTLEGEFQGEDGTFASLASFPDKLLIFFASDTCLSCREETEKLIAEFAANGAPSKVTVMSVLIGAVPEDISFWKTSFNPDVTWLVGCDLDLKLYKSFFSELMTPSVLYFDPETQVLKKWQEVLSIEDLKRETGPWN